MPDLSWKNLFAAPDTEAPAIPVRVFTRGGHPLLVVPTDLKLPGRAALALYSPQTAFARIVKSFWGLRLGFGSPGSYTDTIPVDSTAVFSLFLIRLANRNTSASEFTPPPDQAPRFTLLVGNPHGLAPRCLILLFDRQNAPVGVVKAGFGEAAAALLRHEHEFLKTLGDLKINHNSQFQAVPAVWDYFQDGQLKAFAMPFISGRSPATRDVPQIERVLRSWLVPTRLSTLCELEAWKTLAKAVGPDPRFPGLEKKLAMRIIARALFHGDFAPWNIRVGSQGACTALDWERGQLPGPPAWDWFHYVLQSATLARKQSGAALVETVRGLLADPRFRGYCAEAGLEGVESAWLKAYLLHCKYVLRPKEGAPALDWLLENWTDD